MALVRPAAHLVTITPVEQTAPDAGARQTYDRNGVPREDAPHDERGVLPSRKAYDAAGHLTADGGFFAAGSRKPRKQWAVRS